MADILDKDLNAYDNSPETATPYFLKESEVTPSSFITGEDLERTIRIQNTLKEPIPVELRAFTRSGKQGSGAEVPLTVISDAINDIYEGTKVFAGTLGMQALDAEPLPIKTLKKAGIEIPGITNEDSDFQKTIELLNGRTFPARKAISRVIARSTADIENRKIVRALYDQSHSIDPKAPQVMLPRMLVDAMLLFVPGKSAGLVSRFAGGSRYAATNLAKNITSGVIFAGEGGSYAAETVQEYIDRTGDKNLERFTPEDAHALSALAVGAINTEIEKIGGVFPLMFGSLKRVGLRSNFGKVLAEGAIGEPFENFLQDITRLAARKIDGTTEKTWKDGIQEAFVNSLWTAPVGGAVGVYGHYSNRANLVKGIQATVPNITQEQATQVADAMIDTGIDVVLPNESLRKNLREKVALMYRDIDMDNKEDRIDAMTDLEYSLIAMDAIDRGIDIADHELFQGVVNELGWFRAGIPEAEREKIESINNNIRELRTQLEELNKAEEKDWAKIEEIENKLAQASQYVLENLTDVRKAFQELEDKYVEKEFKATPEQIELSGKTAIDIFDTLSDEGVDIQFANQGKTTKDAATYLQINRKGAKSFQIRFGVSPIGPLHPSVVANFNVETLTQEQILQHIRTLIENKYPRTNKKAKEGVNIGFDNQPMFQNRVSGAAPKTYRGAYIPEYRFILRANKMDASTLSHELAHDWMEVNFDRYRSGKQGKDFMKAWGALEKALGIPEDATSVPPKASETFARAYEAWIVQNEDWAKLIAVEDKDKDAVEKLMKDYQGELRDIYNDITSPYFKQTWGKIGELKPELKAWFDRVVNITDLDTMVERGEMTESQAANEKLNRAIDTVIENTADSDTKQALTEAKVLNDTSRYEVEGGNKNSIQRRLSNLAKEIDENNMVLKGEKYDTRRDMMQVAEAADNFVKTRLDDALAIINGEMAETEGLYKEDLYTALERLAVENGDLNLIDELKNSEVANRLAKELGQRVAGFRNIKQSTDIDVVSALKSLDMKFNKALDNKKAKQEYDAALKLLDESIKQQDKIADKELDNFLDELKCK